MKLLKTFESRIGDAFGAAPEGFAAPFSFRKLARRAAREMENETFEIDGIDTAPALYTILVSSEDDALMRPLYPQITREVVSFVEAQASERGYVFVGRPLARFMVDPSLKSGRFAVFAENVDGGTLARLREEELAFLSGSLGTPGAAQVAPVEGHSSHLRRRASSYTPQQMPDLAGHEPGADAPSQPPAGGKVVGAQGAAGLSEDSVGLEVIPDQAVDEALSDIYAQAGISRPAAAAAPLSEVIPQMQEPLIPNPDDSHVGPVGVPATRRRVEPAPPVAPRHGAVSQESVSCQLTDRQTGIVYVGRAPATVIGREGVPGGIVLRDPNVSRRHAELSFDGRSWHIADLGSTNGTLVNDVDVRVATLCDGDVVTVGLTNLVFREHAS
ncbi:DUF3662 and FHA domain-containing protein [Olsenella sp. HMSC062G07]|uniref:DUF3662 and FHA domain-containing protein n=1 Tax=Olsenella sp. HMSC062G07 TaxID=1739330 RepID=UPI0008A1D1C4|nr:DUF3662 and FHA domain-containing protein [Olsenella sp. HMSC062G07]OFK22230.1 hypothetical protein HMPREF2826_02120 [Olsenella sp. HMSC062G07]